MPRTTKKEKPLFAVPKEDGIIVNLPDAEESKGFVRLPSYLPSRHLRAAQAALSATSVYRTTSKQERANKQATQQKVTAQEVEDFLKAEGFISEDSTISDNFEDPYVDLDKWKMHDTYRRDSTAKRAVTILADFTLGQRTKNTLDLNKQEYTDDKQQKQALDAITNNTTYQAYVYNLDCIDRDVNFDHFLTAAFVQTKVFGRACLLIQDDPQTNLPVALKLVSSMRLGRVFVDELTWRVVAVEYLDYSGLDSIIPADKMLYFTNQDFAISPNVFGFGYSDFEPILDVAETNRQLWGVAIKEINKSQWAPYLVVKMNTKRRSQMQKVADSLKPGIPFIHNQDITSIDTIEMHHDLEKIMNELEINERTIATTIGVPNFLIGKEDVTNRATTATVIDGWSKSKLEKERTWLRGIIEPQWNDRNLKRLIESGIVEQNLPEGQSPMQTIQYPDPRTGQPTRGNVNPANPFNFNNGKKKAANAAASAPSEYPTYTQSTDQSQNNTSDQITPSSQAIPRDIEISKLPFKIKREFEPFNLDVSFEIAQPVIALEQAGIIDATKAREWMHAQDIEARMQELEKQKQLQQQQMLSQFQQMKGAENNAINATKAKQQQQQQQKAAQQQNQPGGIKQVGQNVQPISLSAEGSAAIVSKIQENQKKMQVYDEFIYALREISKN